MYNDNPVCLKYLRFFSEGDRSTFYRVSKPLAHSDTVIDWFQDLIREAILWKMLNHPNILPFLGLYASEQRWKIPCLVSPWISGGNVHEFLRRYPNHNREDLVLRRLSPFKRWPAIIDYADKRRFTISAQMSTPCYPSWSESGQSLTPFRSFWMIFKSRRTSWWLNLVNAA